MSLSEILFLALLGLVIFGPKKLAALGQQAGQLLARWKKLSGDFHVQLTSELSQDERFERPFSAAKHSEIRTTKVI